MRNSTQLSATIRNTLRQLNLKMTRMPGAIIFQHGMSAERADGYIYVASTRDGERAVKIGFSCENASGVKKFIPYVQEEIVHQARLAGFEPIYLSCNGPKGEQFERSIDPTFAIDLALSAA